MKIEVEKNSVTQKSVRQLKYKDVRSTTNSRFVQVYETKLVQTHDEDSSILLNKIGKMNNTSLQVTS